jgi:hypothetical protein
LRGNPHFSPLKNYHSPLFFENYLFIINPMLFSICISSWLGKPFHHKNVLYFIYSQFSNLRIGLKTHSEPLFRKAAGEEGTALTALHPKY